VNLSFRSEDQPVRKPAEWSFPLSQGREAWINEGDPVVYFSQEAALAAQRPKP
jgi:hypothetical protein